MKRKDNYLLLSGEGNFSKDGIINSAQQGNEAGVMIVEGEDPGPHQWQMSPDGGTTIVAMDPTRGGETSLGGLISDKRYYFRNRTILTKGRYGDWSPWYSETAP